MLELDPHNLPAQSVLWGLGLLASAASALVAACWRRIPFEQVAALFGVSCMAAAVMSRIVWMVLEPSVGLQDLLAHPEHFVDPRRPGYNSFGALAGAAGVVALWALSASVKSMRLGMLDVLVPSALAGLSLARLGCLFHGCDFGRPAELAWAVRYAPGSDAFFIHLQQGLVDGGSMWSAPVHPFPLYMFAGALMIVAASLWGLRKADLPPGDIAFWSAGAYLGLRFVVEWTRQPSLSMTLAGNFSVHHLFCIVGLGLVVALVACRGRSALLAGLR